MVKLVFLDKPFAGQVYPLTQEKSAVGRKPTHDLVIPCDTVSPAHCELLVWASQVIVRDLDSANGTFVDDLRVRKQSGAKSGQIIRFGSVKARLEIDPVWGDDEETDPTAIHEYLRAVRAPQEEKTRPAAAPLTLGSDALPIPTEDTVLLKQEPAAQDRTVKLTPERVSTHASMRGWNGLALETASAVLGFGFFLWLLMTLLRR